MNDLVDTGAFELLALVVCITEMRKCEGIMTALFWLDREFATRTGENLGTLHGGLLVFLLGVVHLEWRCTMQNEGS